MIIHDLNLLKDIRCIIGKEVIVYGSGMAGKKVINVLEKGRIANNIYLVDSSHEKIGQIIGGYVVQSYLSAWKTVGEENKGVVVIIATYNENFVDQILETILSYDMDCEIFSAQAMFYALRFNLDKLPESRIKQELWKHIFVEYKLSQMGVESWNLKVLLSINLFFNYTQNDQTRVLVYSPPKTGSTTIQSSIHRCGKGQSLLHVHNIDYTRYLYINHITNRSLLNCIGNAKIIITIREPISRMISHMFEWLDMSDKGLLTGKLGMEYTFEDYISYCTAIIDSNLQYEMDEFAWFRHELKNTLNINILDTPFDQKKGYGIFQHGELQILVVKLEKMHSLEDIIGNFIGMDDFVLCADNASNKKWYRFAYEEFKKRFNVSNNLINYFYKNNPYMDHFYTEEEKAEFLKKWRKKAD